MPRRSPSPKSILGLATVLLIVAALAPARFSAWITWFRGPFMTLVAPASGPITGLSAWLRPATFDNRFDDTPESELQRQLRDLELRYFRSLEQINALEELLIDLQHPFAQPVPTRKLEATRISANLSAGTFDVNRGRNHGVIGGTVAVARRSEQLVGIVTAAGPLVSTVHVLTDDDLEPNLVVGIITNESADPALEDFDALPRAQFRPTGRGTLIAEKVGADNASRISPGDIARLADETWPSAASMLILGRVSRVEPTDDPLFYQITITPLADLARLRSIILSIPDNSQDAADAVGGTGGTGGAGPEGGKGEVG